MNIHTNHHHASLRLLILVVTIVIVGIAIYFVLAYGIPGTKASTPIRMAGEAPAATSSRHVISVINGPKGPEPVYSK